MVTVARQIITIWHAAQQISAIHIVRRTWQLMPCKIEEKNVSAKLLVIRRHQNIRSHQVTLAPLGSSWLPWAPIGSPWLPNLAPPWLPLAPLLPLNHVDCP